METAHFVSRYVIGTMGGARAVSPNCMVLGFGGGLEATAKNKVICLGEH